LYIEPCTWQINCYSSLNHIISVNSHEKNCGVLEIEFSGVVEKIHPQFLRRGIGSGGVISVAEPVDRQLFAGTKVFWPDSGAGDVNSYKMLQKP
jgi:hypothetical protein